eukprot:CAMPEP_0197029600 /NCGR_PEP_ID=MMETSP1384-20130603/9019_1 /TAXON_ID=29189 /ORGANISM="Ammonia sp." /LENGTH=168 /DNA_ID=CAMNT_0042458803 /DNA_START=46 /DNA_END=548 /DNA_ORIENTATION=+
MSTLTAQLTCTRDLHENQQEVWQQCLRRIDAEWTETLENATAPSTEFIVISLPFPLQELHAALDQIMCEPLPTNCFDMISEYMMPTKTYIQHQLALSLPRSSNSYNEWTPQKHAQLLRSEAIIIIDSKRSSFQSVPRHTFGLLPDDTHKWQLSWPRAVNTLPSTQIFS